MIREPIIKHLENKDFVSVNNDLLGRELMMEDEVGMLPNDECIVRVRGFYPLQR